MLTFSQIIQSVLHLLITQHHLITWWDRNQTRHQCSDHTVDGCDLLATLSLPPSNLRLQNTSVSSPPDKYWRAIQDTGEKETEELKNSPGTSLHIKPRNGKGTTPRGPSQRRGFDNQVSCLPQTTQHGPFSFCSQHNLQMGFRNYEF